MYEERLLSNHVATSKGKIIGTVILVKYGSILVKLCKPYVGWGKEHYDFNKYHLDERFTYWWIGEDSVQVINSSTLETE